MNYSKSRLSNTGFTLIEILVSITILGIVITIFSAVFSNSVTFSTKTEDKFSAVNIAERILYNTTNNESVINYLVHNTNQSFTGIERFLGLPEDPDHPNYYSYEINNKSYYPDISVSQSFKERNLNLFKVKVEILMFEGTEEPPKKITEVYGYLKAGSNE
ncbi:type II secretion system protein [Bacillus sp. V5-8f]|uniref:type II secretion system protein n=1 Tax=Bacillus sp. V5-8f TaxID=2053044 RepID=UPI0015E0E0A7|nr:type II secretion system protein [Bacillus sp. V5-8f]